MKKAELTQPVVRYFMIALVVVALQFFGFYTYKSISEKICDTELTSFELTLKDIGDDIFRGSVVEKELRAPCNAQEVLFVDTKDVNVNLFSNAIVRDRLESGVTDNVFVMKQGELKQSFEVGNLDLGFPNHYCFIPQFEEINFFLERKDQDLHLVPGCFQAECTDVPELVEGGDAENSVQDFINFDCPECPDKVERDYQRDYIETFEHITLYRRFTFCQGFTNVEITVVPEEGITLKNFRILENIDKTCIANLDEVMTEIQGGDNLFTLADPLILWHFEEVDEQQEVSYSVNITLSEDCFDTLDAIGVAEAIDDGEYQPHDDPHFTQPFPSQMLALQTPRYNVFDLRDFFDDFDDKREDLTYSISGDSGSTVDVVLNPDLSVDMFPGSQYVTVDQVTGVDTPLIVTFTIEDPSGASASQEVSITVTAAPAINAPDLNPDPLSSVQTFSKYIQLGNAHDPLIEDDLTPFSDLTLDLVSQSNPSLVDCRLVGSDIDCEVLKLESDYSDITISASDNVNLPTERIVRIHVFAPENTAYEYWTCLEEPPSECKFCLFGCNPCVGYTAERVGSCGFLGLWEEYECRATPTDTLCKLPSDLSCSGDRVLDEEPCCPGTDTACGPPGVCSDCNALLDTAFGTPYCFGTSLVKTKTDGFCSGTTCSSTLVTETVDACSGGTCSSGACVCSDGTAVGSCSSSKPMKCERSGSTYTLVEKASSCGCPSGYTVSGESCLAPTCSDGTSKSTCSSNKPKYCNSALNLVDKASTCGCPTGKGADGDSCRIQCSDGTFHLDCSSDKPKRCWWGNLINKAGVCGCPTGKVRSGDDCVSSSSSSGSDSSSSSGGDQGSPDTGGSTTTSEDVDGGADAAPDPGDKSDNEGTDTADTADAPDTGDTSDGGGTGKCFVSGTKISLWEEGTKNIENIEIGDQVTSFNFSSGQFLPSTVDKLLVSISQGYYSINNGSLLVTGEHNIYAKSADGKEKWSSLDPARWSRMVEEVNTTKLQLGDKIKLQNGSWIEIYSLEFVDTPTVTYNLEKLNGTNNYFANRILVLT